jgi:glutathione synthase
VRHIFFIDNLEKLNIRKDSTLMMALTFQAHGHECYVLFEQDFYINNIEAESLELYGFEGGFKADGCYLDTFKLKEKNRVALNKGDFIHMRIDPPFDTRYMRFLWMLDYLESKGINVSNKPRGILANNEKLVAYKHIENTIESYVGASETGFKNFMDFLRAKEVKEVILKPLDLFSGIGVEKFSINDPRLNAAFKDKVQEFGGAIIAQPFIEEVYKGEIRSLFFKGKELGTIMKYPKDGEFLSNIAQGATFEKFELSNPLRMMCEEIAWELKEEGVEFLAFDILGGSITEVNVTCPGLIVEVSYAYGRNLCIDLAKAY